MDLLECSVCSDLPSKIHRNGSQCASPPNGPDDGPFHC